MRDLNISFSWHQYLTLKYVSAIREFAGHVFKKLETQLKIIAYLVINTSGYFFMDVQSRLLVIRNGSMFEYHYMPKVSEKKRKVVVGQYKYDNK